MRRRSVRIPVMLLAAVALTACSSQSSSEVANSTGADLDGMGHVHGLGVDPADGALYIATHMGVFREQEEGFTRVADRWQDTMAFTVVGPRHFLASGHPDLAEKDLPSHLGLIESTDAAETWQPVSLQGASDFHALDTSGDRIVGYDSVTGALATTTDRQRWQVVDQDVYSDVAVDPRNSDRVLATTPKGQVLEYDARRMSSRPAQAQTPPLLLLDWVEEGQVVGATAGGEIHASADGGATWSPVSSVDGTLHALDAVPGAWHVATSDGVFRSTDQGGAWHRVL